MIPAVDVCTDRAADKWVSGIRLGVRLRGVNVSSRLILYCAVERNEPNEAGADMGADREPAVLHKCACGVAATSGGSRDARAWPVAPCPWAASGVGWAIVRRVPGSPGYS